LQKIRKPKISECFFEDSDDYDMNERVSINLENLDEEKSKQQKRLNSLRKSSVNKKIFEIKK
jgi:hypothetical protein